MSKWFGKESRLFGNSAFDSSGSGSSGIFNRKENLVKAGWSSTGRNGGGMQFRIGVGVNAQRNSVANKHVYIPRTFVRNSFSNPFVFRAGN